MCITQQQQLQLTSCIPTCVNPHTPLIPQDVSVQLYWCCERCEQWLCWNVPLRHIPAHVGVTMSEFIDYALLWWYFHLTSSLGNLPLLLVGNCIIVILVICWIGGECHRVVVRGSLIVNQFHPDPSCGACSDSPLITVCSGGNLSGTLEYH